MLKIIGEEIDRKYVDSLKNISLVDNGMKQFGKSLKAVYTPLFGTGSVKASELFSKMGLRTRWKNYLEYSGERC